MLRFLLVLVACDQLMKGGLGKWPFTTDQLESHKSKADASSSSCEVLLLWAMLSGTLIGKEAETAGSRVLSQP